MTVKPHVQQSVPQEAKVWSSYDAVLTLMIIGETSFREKQIILPPFGNVQLTPTTFEVPTRLQWLIT